MAAVRLVRPHIPISVRLQVIARQLQESNKVENLFRAAATMDKSSERLAYMLASVFGDQKVHLDHDPPLCLRHIIDAEKGLYDPAANDPLHLIYRTEEDHRLKTYVRGDGAQLSDAGKRRKKLKQERPDRPSRWPPKGSRPIRWRTS